MYIDKYFPFIYRKGGEPERPKQQQSHLMDLLDISLGATTISSPPSDPWGMSAHSRPQVSFTFCAVPFFIPNKLIFFS